MVSRIRSLVLALSMVALAIAAAGCGDDDDDSAGVDATKTTGSSVAITLKEFEVLSDKDSVPAGNVTFRAKNIGPDDPHELVIVKTDLASGKLPTSADGSADEAGAGVELIGEIEEFAVDGEEEATFDLTAGKYVLLCNVVMEEPDGTMESHYKEGMHAAFTVE